MDLEIAERLIAFKNKMSEQYLVTKEMLDQKAAKDEVELKNNKKDDRPVAMQGPSGSGDDDEESTEEEPRTMVLTKTKK
jgi:hypothetical protein